MTIIETINQQQQQQQQKPTSTPQSQRERHTHTLTFLFIIIIHKWIHFIIIISQFSITQCVLYCVINK